jgi:hypothetical protein
MPQHPLHKVQIAHLVAEWHEASEWVARSLIAASEGDKARLMPLNIINEGRPLPFRHA